MNLLDATLLTIAVVLTLRGVWRGLVQEVASLAGVLLGVALASTGYEALTPWVMRTATLDPGPARLVAFAVLFAGTVIALQGIARLVRLMLRLILLGWLDRLAGGALGLVKAGVLASITVFVLTAFLPPHSELLATSQLVPLINIANGILAERMPEDLRRRFSEGKAALERLRTSTSRLQEMLHDR